ncbi:MAG TPA: hypothetical protein VF363_04390 [Candidatus Eisenbacteria bacterium]
MSRSPASMPPARTAGAARALAAAALFLLAAASPAPAQIDFIPFPPLEAGPGSGFSTLASPYVRTLLPGVTIHPILTVGDTLLAADPDEAPYVFYPLPDGIGARQAGKGLVEVTVTHDLEWEDGLGGARVSRLLLDQRSAGVVAADYVLDGHEEFRGLGAASLAGTREGFLAPTLLINEESTDGPRRGVVAAIDLRNGTLTTLPGLGRLPHRATAIVPISSGRVAAIATMGTDVGATQLFLYLADSDSDFLAGRGQLYVFRADRPDFGENTRVASMASKARPLRGRFVPVALPSELPLSNQPAALEGRAQSVGCLNFSRLEDAAPDGERIDAFYVADAGDANWADPVTGRPVTANGRLYHVSLDPVDPTVVTQLEVVLDGDESDDLYRPRDIATRDNVVMIQEDPGRRGIRPSRILRYDTQTRRLTALIACAERDSRGRLLPEGTGGAWSTTGIVDVSDWFGDDTWLFAVRATTLRTAPFRDLGGGGQLLLLRGPNAAPPRPAKRARDGSKKDDSGD